MEGLADKRLIIFAGKGGVGKTTCSGATALALAAQGKKTLLVTVDPAKRLEDSLGVDVGFEETPIQPNLTAMMLDPESVIREHLQREVPEAQITEHPMFKYVTQYLPGLNELMAIGKLNDFRRENKYDVIVVDTAPTGHALSFLSAPKAIQEMMSEKSLLRWAIRGYGVWQKLQGAAKGVQNVFKKKDERKAPPPDIDFERLFAGIKDEAEQIRAFLTDPEHAAFVVVTLPEKLPVEETIDLHDAVQERLGMTVQHIVVNKVQPDALDGVKASFDAVYGDAETRDAFVRRAASSSGQPEALLQAMIEATRFSEIRREMNLEYIEALRARIPHVPLALVPLHEQDVQGLHRLQQFGKALWP